MNRLKLLLIGILALALLFGGVFTAVRLLASEAEPSADAGSGLKVLEHVIDDGREPLSPAHSGPAIEVIVGPDTIIYHDVTVLDQFVTEKTERRLQQELERVDNLDRLPDAATVEAWGERDGDGVTAEILVFREIE